MSYQQSKVRHRPHANETVPKGRSGNRQGDSITPHVEHMRLPDGLLLRRVAHRVRYRGNGLLAPRRGLRRVPCRRRSEREARHAEGAPNLGGWPERSHSEEAEGKHLDARIAECAEQFVKVNLFAQLPKRNKEVFGEKLFDLIMKGGEHE